MKRTHLIGGLCVIAVSAFGLSTLTVQDRSTEGVAATRVEEPREPVADQRGSFAPEELVAAPGVSQGTREEVPSLPAVPVTTEDPCASVVADLDAAIVVNNAHEKTIAQLNEKLAEVMRERDRFMYGEDTPYGAFLSSYEADEINDPNALVRIEDWLQKFPVFLGVGEATWIAERTGAKDWKLYGRTSELALIRFLGPDRLVAELPPARSAELIAYYADEPVFNQ